jgi:hypothetical protein
VHRDVLTLFDGVVCANHDRRLLPRRTRHNHTRRVTASERHASLPRSTDRVRGDLPGSRGRRRPPLAAARCGASSGSASRKRGGRPWRRSRPHRVLCCQKFRLTTRAPARLRQRSAPPSSTFRPETDPLLRPRGRSNVIRSRCVRSVAEGCGLCGSHTKRERALERAS